MKEIDHWSVESASTAPSGLVKQGVLGKLIFPFHYLFALGENVALRTVLFLRRRLSPMRRRATQVPATNSRYSTALSRVDAILTLVGLFLPARIMKEDAGDAREVIGKLVAASAPTWMIYTKLTSTIFWVLLAAVREVLTVTKKKPN